MFDFSQNKNDPSSLSEGQRIIRKTAGFVKKMRGSSLWQNPY